MSSRRSSFRKRQKPPFERFKDRCRQFTAFMFSNVGIILLVIIYTIGGAFIFQAIELFEYERFNKHKTVKPNITAKCLQKIWDITVQNISFFDNIYYKERVNEILLEFQREVAHENLIDPDIDKQWSFSGAFLYSLTVITTIGYGNISPKSDWGKLVTILYAIIGMPLFLLYLSNIGDVLAKSFKWIYSKVCLCRICPGVARRRIIRERRKLRQLAMSKALQDMESRRHTSSSSDSRSSNSSSSSYYSEETETSTQSMSALENFEEENDSDIEREIRMNTDEITVPLMVCVVIMISYILAGAILFSRWEEWGYLDGSYFCFISLSSIGFGDLVPGERVITADKDKVEVSFILCAVYLLLGMALIAMCFSLMQEQVIHNVRAIKRAFKSCFGCRR
ncbi:PREDICTED: TWiK family of potassium channels protein 18-like isoform X2 [Bactrocera latifrons]|uniref:TWiK family of potassium channels protein 18 n=1 Tax=Bactrocera latifrons TaxID=174628 RepID=A0A0K8V5X3_BACLA|nr:PREDICTED: TWiK family of potassium channels protein 18-like isoform X2 [Bactrocera latifrons]XP_018795873.1 PREDICTED: TWiK family of potassium channels protein 18-like isoform X2 [Bactrocera latifrons]XP_018795875.1 PREDICTED: TWiK family of potassium channels protein 18-like isoform X2 [Bactrocera latifrons]XP_018795876.1 PREDICTED: TWiK family of potassium channels protein 18-like isoform X2 [Bactrocera latifrons]